MVDTFLIFDPATRSYIAADERPKVRGRDWFFATLPVIVHYRAYDADKACPWTVRGVRGRQLLIQRGAGTGSYVEVAVTDTREGKTLNKVIKLFDTMVKLASKAGAARARQAREEAEALDRGACPVCMGDFAVDARTRVVHHGYTRPGHGYIVGDCIGVHYSPWEVAADGAVAAIVEMGHRLENAERRLVTLPSVQTLHIDNPSYYERRAGRLFIVITSTDSRFARELEHAIARQRQEIGYIRDTIDMLRARVATWKPQPFPRIAR